MLSPTPWTMCSPLLYLHCITELFLHVFLSSNSAVVLHATLRLLPILQQVKEGLQLFGLSAIMARHPEVCKALFVPGDEAAVSTL